MPPVLLLALAIAVEVAATVALRSSDGFSRPVPSVMVVLGYALAFYLLALVLRSIPVSVAYAVWSGIGTAAVAVIGMTVLGEPAGALKLASLVAIVVGVVGLNLAGTAS
jgi:small multidrug resistance pump